MIEVVAVNKRHVIFMDGTKKIWEGLVEYEKLRTALIDSELAHFGEFEWELFPGLKDGDPIIAVYCNVRKDLYYSAKDVIQEIIKNL